MTGEGDAVQASAVVVALDGDAVEQGVAGSTTNLRPMWKASDVVFPGLVMHRTLRAPRPTRR